MPTDSSTPPPRTPVSLDVAIVGAGPAGGAAALELANQGLRVGIIEQAVPPRYKTCGGGVLARALKLLPIDVGATIDRACSVAELVYHQPDLQFACRRDFPIVSMVMRDRFDALLVNSAIRAGGVTLHAGTTVRDVVAREDGITLVTPAGDFHARFVIAADGVNSIVARKTGRPALRGIMPAIECETTFAPEVMAAHAANARFDFGLVPAGYGWVFPKSDHLSIGVGTFRRGAANLVDQYRRYLQALGLPTPQQETRHGYMIPCRPRERMFDVPRVLFTGDAAGLADPITAEGITAAILSGQLAAQAILQGRFEDASVRRLYRTTLQDRLLSDLRIARVLAWLLYERPRWAAALLSRHGHGMSELMTHVVTGETTYRTAITSPRHYLRLLGINAKTR